MRIYITGESNVSGRPGMVCAIPQDIDKVLVRNVGTSTVFLGGENVTTSNGFPVEPGEHLEVPCFDSDAAELYAISAGGERKSKIRFLVSS